MTFSGLESLLTGRSLCDRYLVGKVIGRGGMGVVYEGLDQRLQRPVAVKVLSLDLPDPRAEAMLRTRLAREARIAAGIRHPNVVAVFDHGTDPTLQLDFLVMELLEGEDVARRVRRAGFPTLESAIEIFRAAAAGLEAGHRVGLVHRDVKPANLFLESGTRTGQPRLKVLDFGIAQAGPDSDMTMTVAGDAPQPLSPAFASIEQLSGASRLTPASDVFSLGAVAYYLLTGRRAFRSSDPVEVREELRESIEEARRDQRLPRPLVATLEKCLAADPAQRFPTAAELLGTLREVRNVTGRHPGLDEATLLASDLELGLRRALPDSAGQAGIGAAAAPARPTVASRLTRAVARILPALLAGSFGLALFGFAAGTSGPVLLSVLVTTVLLPWLIHRRRGRGSARFALLATVVVTLIGLALMQGDVSEPGAFLFLTLVQLMMAAAASWLSSAPPAPEVAVEEAPSSDQHDNW